MLEWLIPIAASVAGTGLNFGLNELFGSKPSMPKGPNIPGAPPMPETPMMTPQAPATPTPAPAGGQGQPGMPQYQNLDRAMQRAMAQYLGR